MFDFTNSENIGKEYNGFTLLSIDDLPDYKTKAVFLRHKKTGLEVYHILKEDKENLFAFAFRTIAKNSKGCAHIIEHSTLCGSEKYPLKEPFTTLAATSLNTFLNAMTYPDKTVYPGASVVRDDYFNMMDVYADAVFFPILDHATFIQEGHRVEIDEKNNLSIQGVVYNEMKANYSSFRSVAFSELINSMFPDSYPSFDSGGDPLEIPNLTYEEFLEFHQKFYNPDNCLLFLYGDIPTNVQLDFLNERFIDRLEKKYNCTKNIPNADSVLPVMKSEIIELQKLKLVKENIEVREIAPDTGSTGNFVTMNWYSGTCDMEKYYLSEVLFGNDSSPVSMALKDSGLGDEVSCGNFGQFPQEFLTIGLWGVKKENEQKVYDLINKTITDVYENGVDQEDIESAIMGIDFNLREVNRYWGPFSIQIMEKVLKGWCSGKECCNQLTPITSFEKLKKKLKADPDFTKKLIKKYFIDQTKCVKFVSEPSPEYFEKRNQTEKKLISELEKSLDTEQLKKELEELHIYQQHVETPEETKCIPSTKISSLDPKIEEIKTELQFVKGADNSQVPMFVNKEDTNGIFYIDLLFPFDSLDVEYYKYIPFLTNVLTNMGWNGKPWDDCIAESACVMGDVWGRTLYGIIPEVPECIQEAEKYKEYNFMGRNWIGISMKALTDQAKEALELLAQIVTTMSFDDRKRFESLTQELIAEKKASLVPSGRDFALKRVRALWSSQQALNEIMWGISQLYTVKSYAETDSEQTLKTFRYIYQECLKNGGIIHVTADESSLKKLDPLLNNFAKSAGITKLLPAKKYTLEDLKPYIAQVDAIKNHETQVLKIESQTGYAGVVTPCSPYMSKESAAETVFASWFYTHTLWDKIRTTGGAYGAGVWNDNIEKALVMWTYGDPTPQKSIQVYLEALKEIASGSIPQEDIEKTIVSCYGDAIVPASPKDRGSRAFETLLYGNSQKLKQKRIDDLLSVTPQDVKKQIEKLYEISREKCYKAVFYDKLPDDYGTIINIPL